MDDTPPMRMTRSRAKAASVTPITTTSTTSTRPSRTSVPAGSKSAAPKLSRAQQKAVASKADASLVAALPDADDDDDAPSHRDQTSCGTQEPPAASTAAGGSPSAHATPSPGLSLEPSSASMGTPLLMATDALTPVNHAVDAQPEEREEEELAGVSTPRSTVVPQEQQGDDEALAVTAVQQEEPLVEAEPVLAQVAASPMAGGMEVDGGDGAEVLVPSPVMGVMTAGPALSPVPINEPLTDAAGDAEVQTDEGVGAARSPERDTGYAAGTVATPAAPSPVAVPAAMDADDSAAPAVPAQEPLASDPPLATTPSKPKPASGSEARTPVPAKCPTTYVSRTPQPTLAGSSPILASAARRTLTAIKPKLSSGAARVAVTPAPAVRITNGSESARRTAAGPPAAAASVRFQTPASTKAASGSTDASGGAAAAAHPAPSALETSTASKALKSALKTGTMGTPAPSGDVAAPSTAGKRVSISTPVHPKSTSAPRHIVKTPFPKSASKEEADDDGEEEEEEGKEQVEAGQWAGEEQQEVQDDSVPADEAGSPAEAAAADMEEAGLEACGQEAVAGPAAPASCEGAGARVMDAPEREEQQAEEAAEDMETEDAVEASASAVAVVTAASSSVAGQKYDRARAALESMAQADAAASGSTSKSHAALPSYMAPTAAARMRKAAVSVPGVEPSMNQLRRQIREVAAKKLASAQASKVVVQASELRKVRATDKASRLHELDPELGDDGQEESLPDPAAEEALTAAINTLSLGPTGAKGSRTRAAPAPLKGLPQPQGVHVRFDSKGRPKHVEHLGAQAAAESIAAGAQAEGAAQLELKGLPRPTGKHLRFND